MFAGIEVSLQLDFPEPFGVSFLIWSGIGLVLDRNVVMGLSVKEKNKLWGVIKQVFR